MGERDATVWIDGDLVEVDAATIGATDHAITVGNGAFESLQVVDGTPFAITRHLQRLRATADALNIVAPDDARLRQAMHEVIGANGITAGTLRLTVTGGDGPLGSGAPDGAPRVLAAVEPSSWLSGSTGQLRAVTVPWTRNERGALAGLKTTSYAENVRALRVAHQQGATEAIFANTKDELCEGTGTNVFVVIDDQVLTPPLTSGCLAGVTRALVLEHCGATEATLPITVLTRADDVLLTSSTRNVQALDAIDDRELPAPSATARRVQAAFEEILRTNLDP